MDLLPLVDWLSLPTVPDNFFPNSLFSRMLMYIALQRMPCRQSRLTSDPLASANCWSSCAFSQGPSLLPWLENTPPPIHTPQMIWQIQGRAFLSCWTWTLSYQEWQPPAALVTPSFIGQSLTRLQCICTVRCEKGKNFGMRPSWFFFLGPVSPVLGGDVAHVRTGVWATWRLNLSCPFCECVTIPIFGPPVFPSHTKTGPLHSI